jgi:fatty acid-binding protein DegV
MFDLVEKLASKYKEVFYIPISYGVSTTYNSALIVKQDVKNFHVIKSNSGAFANQ